MTRHALRMVLSAASAVVGLNYSALGGISYLSGTTFYTHTPVAGSGTGVTTASDPSMPSSSNLAGVGYTVNATASPLGGAGGQAGSSSTGSARAGFIANSTTASVALKSGTGISQTDPAGGTSYAFSEMRMDFKDATALKWDATSPSFGPTLTVYGSYTVSGTVGAGGFARCFVNLAFYKNSIGGGNSLGSVVLDTGTINTAGAFAKVLTASIPASSASLTTGTDLLMIGTIQFQADNHLAPTEVILNDSAFGSSNSGQVSTYVGAATGGGWFQSNVWSANNESTNAPNTAGERAYIPNDQGTPRTFNLGSPVTVGILDIGGSAVNTFSGASLTLQNSNNARAMIFQRGDYGGIALSLQTPIQATGVITEFLNESSGAMQILQGLATNAVGATIVKSGTGPLTIGGTINHTSSGGASYDLRSGETKFLSEIGAGSSAFQSSVDVGSSGTTATVQFGASQRLDTISIGSNGKARIDIAGNTAIAAKALTVSVSGPGAKGLDLGDDGIAMRLNAGAPIAPFRTLLTSGYNGGDWNGPGIYSSQIASDPSGRTAVGYARVSDLTSLPTITFLGQTVDLNDVVIRYTVNADADLNGTVALADFTRLAANFGLAGDWGSADFNYDGVTNLDDFTALASNFGHSVPTALPRGLPVPEPSAGAVVAVACLTSRRRVARLTGSQAAAR